MTQIIIEHNLPEDMIKILAILCINIQKEYDISPEILKKLINEKQLIYYGKFIYQQCYTEMINCLDTFKNNFTIESKDITTEEYEKCGYLMTSHKNTYISYCNSHKYLHHNPNIPHTEIKRNMEHSFVTKNNNQIIKERYDNSIHLIYQTFINKVYTLIYQIFKYMIYTLCKVSSVMILNDTLDLVAKMKQDNTLFKSKMIYQHIDTQNNTQKKTYYIKLFKFDPK